MKIGLIIYGSLDTLSGGYLYDRRLVEYMRRCGDEVEILPLPRRDYLASIKDNFSPALLRRLAGLNVDMLLQDELNHPSLFLLNRRLKKKAGYPILTIVHHLRSSEDRPGWINHFYSLVERYYLSGVDGFIFNSKTTRDVVRSLLPAGRAEKMPHVIALPCGDRFMPQVSETEITRRAQEDTLRILFVGNVIPRKGLHVLLQALRTLGDSERWTLTIAGNVRADLSYSMQIFHRVADSELRERVCFLGELSDDELAGCMRSSHLLVVPSSYEGYGIVYIEGMGFGLPAIGSTGGAAGEIITDGHNGFLIPPDGRDKLARRISEMIADRPRLQEMSRAALARYHAHPSWDESMDKVRTFLAAMEGSKSGGT